jgi:hypothetical protein
MSTRSTIAIEYENGTVAQIYCHHDGYLSHNGKMLLEHYTKVPKIVELIGLGDISYLGEKIGEKIDFLAPIYDQCKSYKRDRGEKNTGAKFFDNLKDYEKNHQYEEYEYLFQQHTGSWSVFINDEWYDLQEAMRKEKVSEL